MGLFYRAGQFWRVLTAGKLPESAWAEISAVLGEDELALFQRFSNSDRRHSYRVLRTLKSAGDQHADLLAAALLHDIGKTQAALSIWQRSLIVLGSAIFPQRSAQWGQGKANSWRAPFAVKEKHPDWGADMAQKAGSRPLTVELIRRHQEPLPAVVEREADRLLRRLQWADDLN